MRILFIGDVVGKPGRKLVSALLPDFRLEREIDFVVANGENAAGGKGLTPSVAEALYKAGVDALTGGNHTWKNRDVLAIIDEDPRVLRPANFPSGVGVPGRGWGVLDVPSTPYRVGVVNLLGRVFMPSMDCPFQVGREAVDRLLEETPIILVDMHAEATSEKLAMLWHLDGLATAVVGTHTHVPTADEMVTEEGTAYITDAGMTGPYDSILGVRKDIVLHNMLTRMPVRHQLATGDPRLCGALIDVDPESGRALGIERVCLRP